MKPATPEHTVAYIQLGNEDALTSFGNVVTDGWPMVASRRLVHRYQPTLLGHQALPSPQTCMRRGAIKVGKTTGMITQLIVQLTSAVNSVRRRTSGPFLTTRLDLFGSLPLLTTQRPTFS